jgi:hypothetical protein
MGTRDCGGGQVEKVYCYLNLKQPETPESEISAHNRTVRGPCGDPLWQTH